MKQTRINQIVLVVLGFQLPVGALALIVTINGHGFQTKASCTSCHTTDTALSTRFRIKNIYSDPSIAPESLPADFLMLFQWGGSMFCPRGILL